MPGCKDVGSTAEGAGALPLEEEGLCNRLGAKQGVLDTVTGQLCGQCGGSPGPWAPFCAHGEGEGQEKDGISSRVTGPGYLVNYTPGSAILCLHHRVNVSANQPSHSTTRLHLGERGSFPNCGPNLGFLYFR